MPSASATVTQPLLTADGTPLKVSLQRSMRRNKLRATMLVLPTLLFLLLLFLIPIGSLLTRSVDDRTINTLLPATFGVFDQWDRQTLPDEELFKAVFLDLTTINKFLIADDPRRDLNHPAWKVAVSQRGPFKEPILQINPRWGEVQTWLPLSKIVQDALAFEGSRKSH